jgi:hypothetical protein
MSVLRPAMTAELPFTAIRDAIYAQLMLGEPLENLFATLD